MKDMLTKFKFVSLCSTNYKYVIETEQIICFYNKNMVIKHMAYHLINKVLEIVS